MSRRTQIQCIPASYYPNDLNKYWKILPLFTTTTTTTVLLQSNSWLPRYGQMGLGSKRAIRQIGLSIAQNTWTVSWDFADFLDINFRQIFYWYHSSSGVVHVIRERSSSALLLGHQGGFCCSREKVIESTPFLKSAGSSERWSPFSCSTNLLLC